MAASSAAEMKEHRDAEHQHRVAKAAAAQRRWEQEQETRKQEDRRRAVEAGAYT